MTQHSKRLFEDVAGRMRNRVQISLTASRSTRRPSRGLLAETWTTVRSSRFTARPRWTIGGIASPNSFPRKEGRFRSARFDLISTSYVERLNATTRLHMRRLTRLTLAFSKKRENFEAAVGLHFAYYNFVKRHNTLRCTPAMAAGVTASFWSVGDLLEAAA